MKYRYPHLRKPFISPSMCRPRISKLSSSSSLYSSFELSYVTHLASQLYKLVDSILIVSFLRLPLVKYKINLLYLEFRYPLVSLIPNHDFRGLIIFDLTFSRSISHLGVASGLGGPLGTPNLACVGHMPGTVRLAS